jgi:hypothetical protein
VLLGPYSPFEGFRVAVIEDSGVPIEFIQTNLSEDEIWGAPKSKSVLYPEDRVPDSPANVRGRAAGVPSLTTPMPPRPSASNSS